MSNTATTRRLANALGAVNGEGEVVEPLTENEMIWRIVTTIALCLTLVLVSVVAGCTLYNDTEQRVRMAAIQKGFVQGVVIDGKTFILPECVAGIPGK